MGSFLITNKAVEDLTAIWDYTLNTWSENQAEKYYLLLMHNCQELADEPKKGKSYTIIEKNILGYKSGEHIIFYRIISPYEIEIIRILHSMMDLKNRI